MDQGGPHPKEGLMGSMCFPLEVSVSSTEEDGTGWLLCAPSSGLCLRHILSSEKSPSKGPLSWGPGQTGRPVLPFGTHDYLQAISGGEIEKNKNTAVTNLKCDIPLIARTLETGGWELLTM